MEFSTELSISAFFHIKNSLESVLTIARDPHGQSSFKDYNRGPRRQGYLVVVLKYVLGPWIPSYVIRDKVVGT